MNNSLQVARIFIVIRVKSPKTHHILIQGKFGFKEVTFVLLSGKSCERCHLGPSHAAAAAAAASAAAACCCCLLLLLLLLAACCLCQPRLPFFNTFHDLCLRPCRPSHAASHLRLNRHMDTPPPARPPHLHWPSRLRHKHRQQEVCPCHAINPPIVSAAAIACFFQ